LNLYIHIYVFVCIFTYIYIVILMIRNERIAKRKIKNSDLINKMFKIFRFDNGNSIVLRSCCQNKHIHTFIIFNRSSCQTFIIQKSDHNIHVTQ